MSKFKKDNEDNVDLEVIFSILENLKELNSKTIENIVHSYFCNVLCNKSINEFLTKNNFSKITIENLENHYKRFIRNECQIPREKRVNIKKVYCNLFNSIYNKYNERGDNDYHTYKIRYEEEEVNVGHKWIFFTTNYDDSLMYLFSLFDKDREILN